SRRLDVGLAPITDVHEARAQYDAARANTILARNAVADAYQALAEITGVEVRNLKGLPDDFQPRLPVTGDVDEWVATAVGNNPSRQAAEFALQAAEANVDTARSGRRPTLHLGGGDSASATWATQTSSAVGLPCAAPNPIGSESRGPNVSPTLQVPIF